MSARGSARSSARSLRSARGEVPTPIKRVRASARLVLREKIGLDSRKLTDIPEGSGLLVLNETEHEDGVIRARIGKDSSPRGVCVHPLGWVTSVRDGEMKLAPADGSTIISTRHDGGSMASRIAQRRKESARERAAPRHRPAGAGAPPGAGPPPADGQRGPLDEH